LNLALFIQCLLNGVMIGGMYALVASGFTLILGVMKIFNFAQGQFYMLGAFIAYAVAVVLGLPYYIALILALVSMMILGILLYVGLIRWTYTSFLRTILGTLAFSTIAAQSSLLNFGLRSKVMPAVIPTIISVSNIKVPGGKLFIIGVAVIVMIGLYYFMNMKVGKAMQAVAESRDIASLQGINPRRIFWLTMGIGCGLCGIAGALIAPVNGASARMGSDIFIMALLVVMMGGMGSVTGALIAAFVIGIIESFAYQFVSQLNMVVIFAFLAVLIYFRPGGILGKPLPLPTGE
jgi:branched-chain amino acid transport system permease protein